MRILVTGSAGHLGEALMRTLRDSNHEPIGLDVLPSPFTDLVGSIADRAVVRDAMRRVALGRRCDVTSAKSRRNLLRGDNTAKKVAVLLRK